MSHPNLNPLQGKKPSQLIETLRGQIARLEGVHRPVSPEGVSSGCVALDRLLPGGGFRRGTLVEWLSGADGAGAASLAIAAAREACREGGAVVVLDPRHEFYPPAAVRAGIAPHGLLVVQPATEADSCWALDQALRCLGVAALLAWPDRLDGRTFRRLQLAAEEGGCLGLLLRPQAVLAEPSWADVRLKVEPLPALEAAAAGRRLKIDLLRCRHGAGGESIEVEIDDETHTVHLASPLAAAAGCLGRSRAC
jgi:protein ImuA